MSSGSGIRAIAALACAAMLFACRPAPPPVSEPPSPGSYFEDQLFASAIQQAREDVLRERRGRGWPAGAPEFLLPPLGDAPAPLSALCWWLLRFEAGLLPRGVDELRSVSELQAYSRRLSDGSAYWMIDGTGVSPLRFELVVVRDGFVLRSREYTIRNPPVFDDWPFSPQRTLARLSEPGATSLLRDGARLYVGHGNRWSELRARAVSLEVRDADFASAPLTPLPPLPSMQMLREDVRLAWTQRLAADGSCFEEWSVARQGAEMRLPLRRESAAPLRAWESVLTSGGERWVVLRKNGQLELYPVAMRLARRELTASRPQRTPIRLENPGQSGSRRDPLQLWQRSAGHAPLAFLARRASKDGSAWDCVSPEAARGLAASLASRLRELNEGAEGGWLADAFEPASIRSHGATLRIEDAAAIPDLEERLSHPLLWLEWEGHPQQRRAPLEWGHWDGGAAFSCAWPSRPGEGELPPPGASVAGILFSAAAPVEARARVASALTGVGLPELFALDAAGWEPRTPVLDRSWPSFETATAAGSPLHLSLQVDPTLLAGAERERLLRRLEVLLDEHGIRLSLPVGDAVADSSTVLARLTRVALYHDEVLLRAREFASWCGRSESSERTLAALGKPVGDPSRREAAEFIERELIGAAAFVGLWREHWDCEGDGRLLADISWHPLLPPWPAAMQWHPASELAASPPLPEGPP